MEPSLRKQSGEWLHLSAQAWLIRLVGLAALVQCGPLELRAADRNREQFSFTANGQIATRFLRGSGDISGQQVKRRFNLDVDGCRWFLEVRREPDDGHGYVTSCDGTNVYAIQAGMTTSTNSQTPYWAGFIKRDSVPFHSGTRAQVVWIALASECYFASEMEGWISPAWLYLNRTFSSLNRERFQANIRWLGQDYKVPSSIECWADGLTYTENHKKVRAVAAGLGRIIAFRYSVQAETNVGAFAVMSSATMVSYHPRPGAKTEDDVVESIADELRVEELVSPSKRKSNWQIPIPGRVRIQDFRTVDAVNNQAVYDASGPQWPPLDEALRHASRSSPPIPTQKSNLSRATVLVILFGLTAALGAFLLRTRHPPR